MSLIYQLNTIRKRKRKTAKEKLMKDIKIFLKKKQRKSNKNKMQKTNWLSTEKKLQYKSKCKNIKSGI